MTGVGAYDPEGDKSENGGDAHLATDGNAKTAWKTEHYRSTFGKSGVGLVLDAGRPVKASRVVVTTETPGYAAQVQVGNSATGPFSPVSGSKKTVTYDLRAEAPTRTLRGDLDHVHARGRRGCRERGSRHRGRLTVSLLGAIAVATGLFIGLPALSCSPRSPARSAGSSPPSCCRSPCSACCSGSAGSGAKRTTVRTVRTAVSERMPR